MTRKIMMAVTPTTMSKDEQWSAIRFLALENVSGSDNSHENVLDICCAVRYYKINCEPMIQRFKAGWTSRSDKPRSSRLSKRKTQHGMPQTSTNLSNYGKKCPIRYGGNYMKENLEISAHHTKQEFGLG